MVLRFRTEHPHVPWAEAAKQLTLELKPDRPFSEEGLRQTKHRASEKFAEFLFDEVARSLHNPTFDKLEEELIELRLLPYCRGTLDRRRQE